MIMCACLHAIMSIQMFSVYMSRSGSYITHQALGDLLTGALDSFQSGSSMSRLGGLW